jgi:rfaE bifunctional protein kinase chain/domain
MAIDKHSLAAHLPSFASKKVLVLGDLMLDEFTWGRVRRISPEAPVPVVEVDSDTYRPGGCANVSANVKALGGHPLTVGVIGRDDAADKLKALLNESEIDSHLLIEDDRPTTLKTRIMAHGQQVVRTDREDRSPLASAVIETLSKQFLSALEDADAVVVSDYDKGVVNAALLGAVLPGAEQAGVPVFLDPKVHHADYYRPVTLMTPNHRETELLSGMAIGDQSSLEEAGRALRERFGCPYFLITRGEDGMSLFDATDVHHIPASTREVFDVTGAGDTVIATLALAHASGATMKEAAWLANYAAGVVVGIVGTATLTQSELESALTSTSQ